MEQFAAALDVVRSRIGGLTASKLGSDILWNTGSNALVKLRGLLMITIISYFCGVQWYGAWVLVYAMATYCTSISTLGLPNAIVRFFPGEEGRREVFVVLLLLVFGLAFLAVAVIAVGAGGITRIFLKDESFHRLVTWGSLLVLLDASKQMLENYFRAEDDIKTFSMIQGFFPAVEMAVVAAVLAITRDLVTSLQCYIVAGFALEAYIFRKIAAGTSFRSIRSKINVRVFRDYLVYSLPLIPGGFNLLIISSGDRFIIGYLLDPKAVGYYSIAYALASAVLLFNAPVMNSLFPKVAKAYTENDCSGVRRSIRKGMKAYLFAGGVLFLFLVFFGEFLFHLLSGRKGLPGEFSGNAITMLVLVSLIVYGLSRIYSLHLYVQNRTNALFTIYFFGTVVNIGFNIILVKYLGLIGAALATLASYSVMAGLISYFVNRSSYTASQTA